MNGYRKFTGALFKVNDVISKVELLLMSISMVILTAVMSWQVLTRYFIGIPATWAEELCRYLFIWTSFVGSAYAVWMSEHIEIDLIDNVIKAKFKDAEKVLARVEKNRSSGHYCVFLVFSQSVLWLCRADCKAQTVFWCNGDQHGLSHGLRRSRVGFNRVSCAQFVAHAD